MDLTDPNNPDNLHLPLPRPNSPEERRLAVRNIARRSRDRAELLHLADIFGLGDEALALGTSGA